MTVRRTGDFRSAFNSCKPANPAPSTTTWGTCRSAGTRALPVFSMPRSKARSGPTRKAASSNIKGPKVCQTRKISHAAPATSAPRGRRVSRAAAPWIPAFFPNRNAYVAVLRARARRGADCQGRLSRTCVRHVSPPPAALALCTLRCGGARALAPARRVRSASSSDRAPPAQR